MLKIILTLVMLQMPPGMTHDEHLKQMAKEDAMKKRGAAAMGFDQDAIAHHFRLAKDGGSIEADVKDVDDSTSRAPVRTHLRQSASQFSSVAFSTSHLMHCEHPPVAEPTAERLS